MSSQNHPAASIRIAGLVLVILLFTPMAVSAGEGQVELLLRASKSTPITAMQEWSRALGSAGVRNVRISHQTKPENPTIETRSTGGLKVYTVKGAIDGNGNVLLPGGRFTPGDAKKLAAWLDDIAKNGPPSQRAPVDKFGLTLNMTKKVANDFSIPVSFRTEGRTCATVLLEIEKKTQYPILVPKSVMKTLGKMDVKDDLKGFAVGTALVYLVEPFGLGVFPCKGKSGKIEYHIVARSKKKVKPWPIGWEPKNRRKMMPELFKKRTINVVHIPIAKILPVLTQRLKTPVLIDRAALAKQKIDLDKELVNLPDKKISYDRALSNMLSRAKLKYQLLLDDNARPFFWITTLKKK